MDRAQLYKLTELIVAEVVRRIAQEERRRQHPEQVLVLLADSVSFPEKLQQTLNEQFGVAYTPVSIPETNTFTDEALLYAGKLEPGGLLERVKEAKTVILVSPRLELLRRIASGDDGDPLSHLLVRAILWQKDVRVYLDYEPQHLPCRYRRGHRHAAADGRYGLPVFRRGSAGAGGHGPRYGSGCSGRREDGEQNDPLPQRRDHHTRRTRRTGRDRCDPAV